MLTNHHFQLIFELTNRRHPIAGKMSHNSSSRVTRISRKREMETLDELVQTLLQDETKNRKKVLNLSFADGLDRTNVQRGNGGQVRVFLFGQSNIMGNF